MSALQVASLYATLDLRDNLTSGLNTAKGGLSLFGDQISHLGSQTTKLGVSITALSAPIVAAFGVAVNQAANFDEAVTNSGAVLGSTQEQIEALKNQLLDYGGSVRAGPQAVAEAFYDIVGGVADASTHMSILEASVATSEAGNAKLAGTTKALVSVMNSYRFSADKATFASDVLTKTVGMGVGSMDQFASALPNVTGLAASLGISLDDVGSMMAFLTTKGNTASEAATQLGANMSALMKPNEDMKDALRELGFESGEAAIAQLGLMGALKTVAGTSVANTEGMAALLGTQEAVRGSTALLGDDFLEFNRTFKTSVEGATAAAQQIQMSSAAAQFDLLKSSISQISIEVGNALLPTLNNIVSQVRPVIDSIIEWVKANPELVGQIAAIFAGGAILGGGLVILGTVLSAVGTIVGIVSGAFSLLSGAVTFLLSPAGLLIAAIAGIIFVLDKLYPGGISKLLSDAATSASQLAFIIMAVLGNAVNWIRDRFTELLTTIQNAIGKIIELKNTISGGLGAYGGAVENAGTAIGMVTSGQVTLGDFLNAAGNAIGAELGYASGGYTGNAPADQPVGVVHGREWVVPENGALVLRGGEGSGITISNLTINASTTDGGRAAADAFSERLRELRRERG